MKKLHTEIRKLGDLRPDPDNANDGTERGAGMVEASLREYGAGRSILVDRHGTVIAGNKTLEAAASIGLDEIVVVPSDGRRLVVVQRTDLDLNADVAARELAVADNRAAEVGLAWNADALLRMRDAGADLARFFSSAELSKLARVEDETEAVEAPAKACERCRDLEAQVVELRDRAEQAEADRDRLIANRATGGGNDLTPESAGVLPPSVAERVRDLEAALARAEGERDMYAERLAAHEADHGR